MSLRGSLRCPTTVTRFLLRPPRTLGPIILVQSAQPPKYRVCFHPSRGETKSPPSSAKACALPSVNGLNALSSKHLAALRRHPNCSVHDSGACAFLSRGLAQAYFDDT